MKENLRKAKWPIIAVLLIATNVFIYSLLLARPQLRVTVLDIGQGDSILIEGPTGITMLIDGGPDRSVLRELGAVLPLARHIDAVVETHPDKDHIGGLPDVFDRYSISYFINPGIPGTTNAAAALTAAAAAEPGLTVVTAKRGMRLNLGGGAYADILWPDRDASRFETNYGSVTMHLVYGRTSFMFTGDLPSEIEDYLVRLDAHDGELKTDLLKVGHHGSKYSTDNAWLAALQPSLAAISVGATNTYGHPTPETLARIASEGAVIKRTDLEGRLLFSSDGVRIK